MAILPKPAPANIMVALGTLVRNGGEIFWPDEAFAGVGPLSRLPRRQRQVVRIRLKHYAPIRVAQTLQCSPPCPIERVTESIGDREPLGVRPGSSRRCFPCLLVQSVDQDALSRTSIRPMENGH